MVFALSSAHSLSNKETIFPHLTRLARFGANILDAYSCFIFLPSSLIKSLFRSDGRLTGVQDNSLFLAGAHSLCQDLVSPCVVRSEDSLVGWVASHNKSILLAPFERESSIIGTYRKEQELKSLLAIPFTVPSAHSGQPLNLSGVILCDSKKSFAFTKLQSKLLEELGLEASTIIQLLISCQTIGSLSQSWEEFLALGMKLLQSVGAPSLEAVRLIPKNTHSLERDLGTKKSADFLEQIYRLIAQAIPPHYPLFRTSTGEVIILVDHMMAQVYLNKIETLLDRTTVIRHENSGAPSESVKVEFSTQRKLLNPRDKKDLSLENLILGTLPASETQEESTVPFLKKLINF